MKQDDVLFNAARKFVGRNYKKQAVFLAKAGEH
jgi:hypothetical protein